MALLAAVDAGAAKATPSNNAPTPTRAESLAIALRAQYGLENDLAFVRAADSAANSTTADLGIPLTPSEHAELARRDQLGSAIASIDQAFTGTNFTYVGSWLDQASGGVLNVSYTTAPSPQTTARLQALLPPGGSARVTVVPNSLATLTTVAAKVTGEMIQNGQKNDLTIIDSGVDLPTDSVEITILKSAPSDEEAVLAARYGPTLTITRGEQAFSTVGGARDIRGGLGPRPGVATGQPPTARSSTRRSPPSPQARGCRALSRTAPCHWWTAKQSGWAGASRSRSATQ